MSALVIYAIVELYSLVPVIDAGAGIEAVVARGFCGILLVGLFLKFLRAEGGVERAAGEVVEIIVGREAARSVIILAQIPHACRPCIALVAACHVVGHEVHDHFQVGGMGALYESVKFAQAVFDVDGQVGVNVVIVLDGVGGAGFSLDDGGMVALDAVGSVICLGSVFEKSRVPHVCKAERADALQFGFGEIVHLATPILGQASTGLVVGLPVAVEAWKYLVDEYAFLFGSFFCCLGSHAFML